MATEEEGVTPTSTDRQMGAFHAGHESPSCTTRRRAARSNSLEWGGAHHRLADLSGQPIAYEIIGNKPPPAGASEA